MEIVVQDTNILIDLVNIGLIDYCRKLDIDFHTTDIAVKEIHHSNQYQVVKGLINEGALKVDKLQGADLIAFSVRCYELQLDSNVTPADCSVMYLAEKMKCRLLTSDQKLKRQAVHRGITVNGLLWLTDRMMEDLNIPPLKMAEALQSLLISNARAPRDLILERIDRYLKVIKTINTSEL